MDAWIALFIAEGLGLTALALGTLLLPLAYLVHLLRRQVARVLAAAEPAQGAQAAARAGVRLGAALALAAMVAALVAAVLALQAIMGGATTQQDAAAVTTTEITEAGNDKHDLNRLS